MVSHFKLEFTIHKERATRCAIETIHAYLDILRLLKPFTIYDSRFTKSTHPLPQVVLTIYRFTIHALPLGPRPPSPAFKRRRAQRVQSILFPIYNDSRLFFGVRWLDAALALHSIYLRFTASHADLVTDRLVIEVRRRPNCGRGEFRGLQPA